MDLRQRRSDPDQDVQEGRGIMADGWARWNDFESRLWHVRWLLSVFKLRSAAIIPDLVPG